MWETLLRLRYCQTANAKYTKGKLNILVQRPGQHQRTGAHIGQDAKSEASLLWCATHPSADHGLVITSIRMACLQAFDCVPETAITAAAESLQCMLHDTPSAICQRLVENDADIAIMGRDQVVSDMPPHGHLRGQSCAVGDRTFDHGTRGVGGNLACPTCSVGMCAVGCPLQSPSIRDLLTVELQHIQEETFHGA